MHENEELSPWIRRWTHLVAPGGTVLDVACGRGRHLRWFAGRGHAVAGVDRDPEAIAAVAGLGEVVQADIENGPDFLLAPGELLQAYGRELRVVAFEDGFLDAPPRFVQRIAAVRERPGAPRARYML